MKKKLFSGFLALVLALCLTAPALAAGFTDVPDSHWASGYIQHYRGIKGGLAVQH